MRMLKRKPSAALPKEKLPSAAPEQEPAPQIDAEQRVLSTQTKVQQQLAASKQLKDKLLTELARGEPREAELAAITKEIADLEQRESWHSEALAKLRKANSAEAKGARWTATRDECQAAVNDARALKERIERFIAAVAPLGDELRAIEAARADVGSRIAAAIDQLPYTPATERRIGERHDRLRKLVDALGSPVNEFRSVRVRNAEDVAAAIERAGENNHDIAAKLVALVNETLVTLKGV